MLFPDDKNWFFSVDAFKNLTVTENKSSSKILAGGVISFDAVCPLSGKAEVFFSTEQVSLVHISYDGKKLLSRTLMTSKNAKGKICSVKVIEINGRYHVFYCLDSEKRYLVHQIVSDEHSFRPEVIDGIGKRFIYSVVKDEDSDIHIVYEAEGVLKYKKYVYSEKRYTPAETVCGAYPRKLCVSVWKDKVFAAFTEPASQACRLYLAKVCGTPVKKALMPVDKDSAIALNCGRAGIRAHISEAGICYEIESDYELNVKKPKSIGKSYGMRRIRFCDGSNLVRTYPVNRHMLPYESYVNFRTDTGDCPKDFAPTGVEAEKFAGRYKEAFADRITELINEDLLLRLARIEASLAKLTEFTEKAIEEIKKSETPSS